MFITRAALTSSVAASLLIGPGVAFAQSCSVWFDANPINAGQGTTVHWTSSVPTVLNSTYFFYINGIGYVGTNAEGSASIAPGATTDYTGTISACSFWGGCFSREQATAVYTCPATLTVIQDPCPTPIESYWGAGNYLLWSTATRRINAAGINVCATNNAGSHYFVPGRTYDELQSFINAGGRLGVSIF